MRSPFLAACALTVCTFVWAEGGPESPREIIRESAGANNYQVFVTPVSSDTAEKPVDWFARFLGGLGAFVGIASFVFSLRKARRDRQLSIDDDFWLRKVLAPAVIEPLIEEVGRLAHACPDADSSAKKIKQFAYEASRAIQKLKGNLGALSMVDADLPETFSQALDACEDSFIEATQGDISRLDLQAAVWEHLTTAFKKVRDHQLQR